MTMSAQHPPRRPASLLSTLTILTSFLFGLALASAFFLWHAIHTIDVKPSFLEQVSSGDPFKNAVAGDARRAAVVADSGGTATGDASVDKLSSSSSQTQTSLLSGLRILVTIVSFDFMQLAHLEEVLDGFQDLCYAGSMDDVVVYTTVVVSLMCCCFVGAYLLCNWVGCKLWPCEFVPLMREEV